MIYFRRCPRILDDAALSNITTLTLLLIASQKYIRNPYLLVKLVEVRKIRNLIFKLLSLSSFPIISLKLIFVMTPGVQERQHNLLDLFLGHPLSVPHLAPALMKIYIGTVIWYI